MSKLVLEKFHEILCDQLEQPLGQWNRKERAANAMEGLKVCGNDAGKLVEATEIESASRGEIAALIQIASCLDRSELVSSLISSDGLNLEVWMGIGLGLRLCRIDDFKPILQRLVRGTNELASSVALDVLLFHRQPVSFDPRGLLSNDNPEIRSLTLGALGRSRDPAQTGLIGIGLEDSDPVVRRDALRSAAMCGMGGLKEKCKVMATRDQPCLNAVRFLGVICDEGDFGLLRQLASSPETAGAAIEAMGVLGAAELVPDVVRATRDSKTAHEAAVAIERIGGRAIPRSDPPDPPEGLSEEELDFWSHPGEPDPEQADVWWNANFRYYKSGKRYQAGKCVSDDPLGPVFDELPDEVRRDVYLRQRALDFQNTPDWELETWPKYLKNPAWCFENRGES